MYKHFYKDFLKQHQGSFHLAAHSHHFWPDITKKAHMRYWEDASRLSDEKWSYLFSRVIPKSQKLISSLINYSRPSDIAFAPNVHELIARMLSCFYENDKIRILTTTSEFHSVSRQLDRLKQWDKVTIDYLDNEAKDFDKKLTEKLSRSSYDIIIISHVFYNSGLILPNDTIRKIIKLKGDKTVFCLDGYHHFCALPFDLRPFEDDLYYLSGGYKYAQAGEGMCFMTLPKSCELTPIDTGWFASFDNLNKKSESVQYSNNGMRMWGATTDLSSHYRFQAVWDLFERENITILSIDEYIKELMCLFITELKGVFNFLNDDINNIGHFLTVECSDEKECESIYRKLKSYNILTDYRANRLRFGFGTYIDLDDTKKVIKIIKEY